MAVTKEGQAEPIDLAAHLQLLGESLCTVGACLRVQVSVDFHAGGGDSFPKHYEPEDICESLVGALAPPPPCFSTKIEPCRV